MSKLPIKLINNYMGNNNAYCVELGNLTLYFSYETIIAFDSPESGLIIRENDWSATTGKHLNAIDSDKSIRINGSEFEESLKKLLTNRGF